MMGRELYDNLGYLGMERQVRELALEDKLATIEELATMGTLEVCDLVVNNYTMVYTEGEEEIGLVRNDNLNEYESLIKRISR